MDTIHKSLMALGVPPHVYGFDYIHDAVDLILSDKQYVHAITKRLYPAVALMNDTTPSRVEKAIRHAIGLCMMRAEPHALAACFGGTIDREKGVPSNALFLTILALHLEDKEAL